VKNLGTLNGKKVQIQVSNYSELKRPFLMDRAVIILYVLQKAFMDMVIIQTD